MKSVVEIYDQGLVNGYCEQSLAEKQTSINFLNSAVSSIEIARLLCKSATKQSNEWRMVFKSYYEAIAFLSRGLLNLQHIFTQHDQFMFAALCIKYSELELEWGFLENLRGKYEKINEEAFNYNDWKKIELQMNL